MNTNRNFTTIFAAAALVAALPAGAQVLGGGLMGGGNAGLGGALGQVGGSGNGTVNGGFDGGGRLGSVRDRAQAAGARTHDAATSATSAARTRAQQSRDALSGAATASQSAAASAGGSVRDAQPAMPTAPAAPSAPAGSSSGLLDGGIAADGTASGSTERQAMGRTINANGGVAGNASADRSGVDLGGAPTAGASVKRTPAPATETAPQ